MIDNASSSIHAEALAFIENSYRESTLRNPNEKPLVGIVGWSRGALISQWVARDLNPKNISVDFLGMYDPVDMSEMILNQYNVSSNTILVRSIGPDENSANWDYRDWERVTKFVVGYSPTTLEKLYVNASHGSIGGTPGFSWTEPTTYVYSTDRANSILSDRWIREGLNTVGFVFRYITDDEYGFPGVQPIEQ